MESRDSPSLQTAVAGGYLTSVSWLHGQLGARGSSPNIQGLCSSWSCTTPNASHQQPRRGVNEAADAKDAWAGEPCKLHSARWTRGIWLCEN